MVDSPYGPHTHTDPTHIAHDTIETMYHIDTPYALSLNPPDKHQYFGNPHRESKFYDFMQKMLLQLDAKITLWIEYSQPRGSHPALTFKGPRLHAHGIIKFSNIKQLRHFMQLGYYSLTRWSRTDIDTIADMPHWLTYCQKEKIVKPRYRKITHPYKISQSKLSSNRIDK